MAAGRQRVLIVEDELLIAALLATQASEAGYDLVGPVGRVGRLTSSQRWEPSTPRSSMFT